jgi:CheY-like chemotaxis protein
MNGYDVARALRHLPETRDAWIVALTGYGRPDDVARALREGFDQHLTKPVDPEFLLDAIDNRSRG